MLTTKKKLLAFALVGTVILTWVGVVIAVRLFDPSMGQKTVIVTVAAIISEVALWIGVALLGITALDKFRLSPLLRKSAK